MGYVKYLRDVLGEGFKEFVTKFSSEDENINVYVDKFKLLKTRNKIKGVEADIDYWIKKDFNSFKTFVDKFVESELKSRKEVKKEAYKNIVAENEEYVIIKINNAGEIYALGKGTVWCIASGEKPMAELYYKDYSNDSNFYVAIKKNIGEPEMRKVHSGAHLNGESIIYPYWDKIAIQVEANRVTYYNTGDFGYSEKGLVDANIKINLPEYEFRYHVAIPDYWDLNEDGTYDVMDDVRITNSMIVGGKFPVKFNKVMGIFDCSGCNSLTSLEGAPKSVNRFKCSGCNSLTSLEGAPVTVVNLFDCSSCDKLTSLKGSPKSVYRYDCSFCDSLTSLEGAPENVSVYFKCDYCDSLASLEGAPSKVGNFTCISCGSLVSLEGAPNVITGDFKVKKCKKLKLSSLTILPLSYRDKVIHDLS